MNNKIAILGSTQGTNLQPLVELLKQQSSFAEISLVISNQAKSGILQRAQKINIPNLALPHHGLTRLQHEYKIHQQLKKNNISFVILLGYMRIFTLFFTRKWKNKIINVHPSLLPKHKGLMDLAVHQAVINARETKSGCTVHYVTSNVDSGEIITQKKCNVAQGISAQKLKQIIQPLEVVALAEAITVLTKEPQANEIIS